MADSIKKIVIIGAGFTGLTAGLELVKMGINVTILEKDSDVGGLAGSFSVGGKQKLEKFYHHWFTNDEHIMALIHELGLENKIRINETSTGMYFANRFYKLSAPADLLMFSPIPFLARIRVGIGVLAVRLIKNWKKLEKKSASSWLKSVFGEKAYQVMWEPLLKGKFGRYSDDVSAVWFWNKLKLRGGSRNQKGKEALAYFEGGFGALADFIAAEITRLGGKINLGSEVTSIQKSESSGFQISYSSDQIISSDTILFTTPIPIVTHLGKSLFKADYLASLQQIKYIGNVCLVLILDRSLSETYWLNVNDPDFPFVGVIEHTNFENREAYAGNHIVYLSKYLPADEPLYTMTDDQFLNFSVPFIQRMFPTFSTEWIRQYFVWRSPYSQPLVTKGYSEIIPDLKTPVEGVYLSTMAQIYPEDRGTNYAVREGKKIAGLIKSELSC
ncbi:MAG: NAD(P)/FAD-dependent oxidoreductase [Bacteroidetes bacterium]|nr:NAD(P)/FAD-dependent oxidoreductase [Bacteroidota bacterium]